MTSEKPANDRVPLDFPRPYGGSVSGVQSKLTARKIDGRFVDGMTDDELVARYDACQDLAIQLAAHSARKRGKYPDLSLTC